MSISLETIIIVYHQQLQDLVVGAPRKHGNVSVTLGWVGVYSGTGTQTTPFWSTYGEQFGAYFGKAVQVVDVNGDGYPFFS